MKYVYLLFRFSETIVCTSFWTTATWPGVTGCTTWILPTVVRSRTWRLARSTTTSTSTRPNPSLPTRNSWSGTAGNMPTGSTVPSLARRCCKTGVCYCTILLRVIFLKCIVFRKRVISLCLRTDDDWSVYYFRTSYLSYAFFVNELSRLVSSKNSRYPR